MRTQFDRETCREICHSLMRAEIDSLTGQQSAETRDRLFEDAKKLCWKLETEHDTLAEPIRVTIRSVPVQMYANVLRHYYIRVEDVLDVHPGTRTRLALAWWHNTTVLDTDTQERELSLCGSCCDRFLEYVWRNSDRFNIVWNNCDQILNKCRQSFALGVITLQIFWYSMCRDLLGLLLMVTFTVLFLGLRMYTNTRTARDMRCDKLYCCEHVLR